MKTLRWILLFLFLLVVALPLFRLMEPPGPPPELPISSDSVKILLVEPDSQKKILEKSITDPLMARRFLGLFLTGTRGIDHKCDSLGKFVFQTGGKTETVFVLPGHVASRYEIRHGKDLYTISREKYVNLLVEAGISKADIRLDGHPDVKPPQP